MRGDVRQTAGSATPTSDQLSRGPRRHGPNQVERWSAQATHPSGTSRATSSLLPIPIRRPRGGMTTVGIQSPATQRIIRFISPAPRVKAGAYTSQQPDRLIAPGSIASLLSVLDHPGDAYALDL